MGRIGWIAGGADPIPSASGYARSLLACYSTAVDEKVEPCAWHPTRMRASAVDLRERVVAAGERKLPRSDVAVLFGVRRATMKQWLTHRRTRGTLVPTPAPGRPPTLRPAPHAAVWAQLEAHPAAPLTTHCQLWEQTQPVRGSTRAMARALQRLGGTRTQRRWVPPRALRCCAARRASRPPGGSSMAE